MRSVPETGLTLLYPDGAVASSAIGILSDSELLDAFRLMILSREIDKRAVALQREGRAGTHAPAWGQEAAIIGSALAVDPERDWLVPQYREVAACLRHGVPLVAFWLRKLGMCDAQGIPQGVKVLPIAAAIAAQIPHAVGLAWGLQLQGSDAVVLTYFGDGATSQGDFHEATNFAGVLSAPVVLFCQNNGWALTTPTSLQTAAISIAARGDGYGIPGVLINGNDVLAVYQATRQAVDRARAGDGPTLIEAVTHRAGMHNTSDDPSQYWDSTEEESWREFDPLDRLRRYLLSKRVIDRKTEEHILAEAQQQVHDSFLEALGLAEKMDPVSVIFDHVFASPTPRQDEQKLRLCESIDDS